MWLDISDTVTINTDMVESFNDKGDEIFVVFSGKDNYYIVTGEWVEELREFIIQLVIQPGQC